MSKIEIGVVMGSQSDWSVMREATAVLDVLELGYECKIVSAHRTPDRLWQYGETAGERGLKVIIAGAGGGGAFARHACVQNDYSNSGCADNDTGLGRAG